jgi:hypothetical protein
VNLPHCERARVDRTKIQDYLLAFEHPDGANKAEFFSRFGFAVQDWETFAAALISHGQINTVISSSTTAHGVKYCVDGPLHCPDGRAPLVRSVWIIDAHADFPRLVTAHPL